MVALGQLFQNEYLLFLIIIVSTLLFVLLSYIILRFIVRRIVGKKKFYQNFILQKLTAPVLLLVFFVGLFSALRELSILSMYTSWIDGIFFIIVTFIIAFLAANIITIMMLGYLKIRKGFQRQPRLLNKVISIIIYIIAIAIILSYFKIDITPLVASVGLGALAIGLALQSTLANFFAGLHIVSDQPVRVGDFIELDKDTMGFVEDIGWRSTRIKTMTDNMIILPNSKLADSTILNYSMPKQDMSFWVPCGVAYESDLEKVEQVTLEVARKIQKNFPGAVRDFEPLFRFSEFDESNINFIAILRVEEPMKRYVTRNEFIKKLKKRFDEEGIEISWPIRKIYNIKPSN